MMSVISAAMSRVAPATTSGGWNSFEGVMDLSLLLLRLGGRLRITSTAALRILSRLDHYCGKRRPIVCVGSRSAMNTKFPLLARLVAGQESIEFPIPVPLTGRHSTLEVFL